MPECFAAFKPQPQCPVCGAQCVPIRSTKIRQIMGELEELRRESIQQRIAERDRAKRQRQAARKR
jgi:hypothetical protein